MKKFITGIVIITIVFSNALISHALVFVDNEGNYETDVDKYLSQKKVKVNNSTLADKLENTMQRANKGLKEQNNKSNMNKKERNTNYRKTYKWF